MASGEKPMRPALGNVLRFHYNNRGADAPPTEERDMQNPPSRPYARRVLTFERVLLHLEGAPETPVARHATGTFMPTEVEYSSRTGMFPNVVTLLGFRETADAPGGVAAVTRRYHLAHPTGTTELAPAWLCVLLAEHSELVRQWWEGPRTSAVPDAHGVLTIQRVHPDA